MRQYIQKFSWQLCAFCAAIAMLSSCSKEDISTSPCIDGDCTAQMVLPGVKDTNGYYHIDLNWDYRYFTIDAYASKMFEEFEYNGIQVVEANFYSDGRRTTIHNNISVTEDIVQNSTIYFREQDGRLHTRRVVGPFPDGAINDTITIRMEVFWEAGNSSVLKTNFFEKFIVE